MATYQARDGWDALGVAQGTVVRAAARLTEDITLERPMPVSLVDEARRRGSR